MWALVNKEYNISWGILSAINRLCTTMFGPDCRIRYGLIWFEYGSFLYLDEFNGYQARLYRVSCVSALNFDIYGLNLNKWISQRWRSYFYRLKRWSGRCISGDWLQVSFKRNRSTFFSSSLKYFFPVVCLESTFHGKVHALRIMVQYCVIKSLKSG